MTRQRLPTLVLEVRRTLRPGDPGTHKLLERRGDRLVRFRYRFGRDTNIRMTCVELVVDTALSVPRPPRQQWAPCTSVPSVLYVRIGFGETALRERAKAAAGRWVPERRLWALPAAAVRALSRNDRAVQQGGDRTEIG